MKIDRRQAAALMGLLAISAQASRGDDTAALTRLLSDHEEQQHVISAAARSTVVLQNPCADAQFTIEPRYVLYRPLSFDDTGRITSGAWKQLVTQKGCGETRVLNVIIIAQGPGSLSTVPLLPGTTHADPVLQKDAVRIALQAMATVPGAREANCSIGYVADTQYGSEDGEALPGSKGPPWREIWTFRSCTQDVRVPIRFIPDATGTSISAGPNKAIQVVRITH
jgi:hypothetical protein